MLREGRELIPTAKAFQLMTLLRGLEINELSRADLTGEWEYKLSEKIEGKIRLNVSYNKNSRLEDLEDSITEMRKADFGFMLNDKVNRRTSVS